MPKVWMLTRDRFPGERAHSINQIRMCDGFADLGCSVNFLFPDHPFRIKRDIQEFYGVRNKINYFPLPCFYLNAFVEKNKGGWGLWGNFGQRLNTDLVGLSTTISVLIFLIGAIRSGALKDGDLIYGRSGYSALIAAKMLMAFARMKVKVAVEIHIPPKGRFGLLSYMLKKLDHVFVISQGLVQVVKNSGEKREVTVLPDGIDIQAISSETTSLERQEILGGLGIDASQTVVCYAGHLYPYKGVEDLISAAGGVKNLALVIVGGMPDDLSRCRDFVVKNKFNNVSFVGFVAPSEVAKYIRSSDICVYTLRPDAEIRDYTSPIKIFEYMGGGVGVVAASVPGVREVLIPDFNGELYEPGNIKELRVKILKLRDDAPLRKRLGATARDSVQKYSWTARARIVLNALNGVSYE